MIIAFLVSVEVYWERKKAMFYLDDGEASYGRWVSQSRKINHPLRLNGIALFNAFNPVNVSLLLTANDSYLSKLYWFSQMEMPECSFTFKVWKLVYIKDHYKRWLNSCKRLKNPTSFLFITPKWLTVKVTKLTSFLVVH